MTKNTFSPFPILKTSRLTLRQLLRGDENELYELRSNADVNKYLDREPAKSIEDARDFIRKITEGIKQNESMYWAITFNNDHKLIGTICYFNFTIENGKAEVGYELLPYFQGKGIMHEALCKVIEFGVQNMGIHQIEAYIHQENKNSIKLLEKHNFEEQKDCDNGLSKNFIKIIG